MLKPLFISIFLLLPIFVFTQESFEDYYKKAHLEDDEANYEQALRSVNKALEIKPKNTDALYLRARMYFKLHDFEKGEASLVQVLKYDDQYARAWMLRGNIQSEQENYLKSLTYYDKALKIKPNDYLILYNRGLNCYQAGEDYYEQAWKNVNASLAIEGEYQPSHNLHGLLNLEYKEDVKKSLADFARAIELEGGAWWPNKNRALIYKQQKQYKNALYGFNRTLNCTPPNKSEEASAYYDRGSVYVKVGQLEKALADFNKADELIGYDGDLYFERANVLVDLKKYKEAEVDIEKVLKEYPKVPAALNTKGLICYYTDRDEEALQWYQKAIEQDPSYLYAHLNIGNLYAWHDKLQEALASYNKALEIKSTHWAIYKKRGHLYYRLNEDKKAIEDYNTYLKEYPKAATIYNSRGLAYIATKDFELALNDLNKAIQLAPEYALAYSNRGELKRRMGDVESAWLDWEKAIELNPKEKLPYYNMGNVEETNGNMNKACACWKTAKDLGHKVANEKWSAACQ